MWNMNVECYGTNYKCLMADKSHKDNCTFYEPAPPPPKTECVPINGTCREYNSCRIWEGFCGGPYQCVTDVQYYQYTHEPPPPMCPPPPWPLRSDPPGECIYQHGKCVWSSKNIHTIILHALNTTVCKGSIFYSNSIAITCFFLQF